VKDNLNITTPTIEVVKEVTTVEVVKDEGNSLDESQKFLYYAGVGFVGFLLIIALAYVIKGKERDPVARGYTPGYDTVGDRTRMGDVSLVSMEPQIRRASSKVAPIHDPVSDMALQQQQQQMMMNQMNNMMMAKMMKDMMRDNSRPSRDDRSERSRRGSTRK